MARVFRAKVVKTRHLNTYSEMWRVSYWTLRQAKEEPAGSFFQIMASLIFTAFTLEAYLNHIGAHIFESWDDLDRISLPGKLSLIAEKLGVHKDDGKRPFQTVKRLFKFRNDVAHGKTRLLKDEEMVLIREADIDKHTHKELKSEWEAYATLANAIRAREDVEKVIELLHDAAGNDDDLLWFTGVASASASLE